MAKRGSEKRLYLFEHLSVLVVVAGLCVLLSISGAMSFLSRDVYDNMMRLTPMTPSQDVLVVGIDEKSLRDIGRWPWDRRVLARLVTRLSEQGARTVIMDLILSEPDRADPGADQALVAAIQKAGNVYLPVHVERSHSGGEPLEVLPYAPFARAAKGLGHVDLELGADGVACSVYLRSGIGQPWWPHIALALLQQEGLLSGNRFPAEQTEHFAGVINVRKYLRRIPFAGGSGTYAQVSATDLLHGKVPRDMVKGKFVLIGATAAGLGDTFSTPTAGKGESMSGVEVNANILDGLRQHQMIRDMDVLPRVLLGVALALLMPLLLPLFLPRWSIPLLAGSLALTLGVCFALLVFFNLWFAPGAALLSSVIAYPLWTWRRLEYSLGYMRNAMARLAEYSDLNRRLTEPAPLSRLLRMLDQVLPVRAWRLQTQGRAPSVFGGEEAVFAASTHCPRRSYPFRHQGKRHELTVLWHDQDDAETYDYWIRAMLARTETRRRSGGPRYEVMEQQVERLRSEEQRQQALTRFFQVGLARLREGVLITDACGGVVFINDRADQLLNLEGLGQDSLGLADIGGKLDFNGDNNWTDLVRMALADGRVQRECRNHRDMDLYLDLSLVHAGDYPGHMLIVTIKDISDVKQAMRTRTEMLHFLSHDLRSPMVSVLALVDRMRQHEEPAASAEFLDDVAFYAQRNLGIAEQFLQLARVESEETVEMIELDMLDVVEAAVDQIRVQAQERRIELHFEYNPDEDIWVYGNNELLERLMVNLLTNAVKYSDPGGDVRVLLYARDDRVYCEVVDDGAGIPEDFQARLFDRFSRASTSGGAGTRGAGLGLRFVKVVTERHGGDIRVHSRPGEGSRFILSLARVDVSTL